MTEFEIMKDVHTEHCCFLHGCEYGSWQLERTGPCTVKSGEKPQSYMCEVCSDEIVEGWDDILLLNEMFDAGRRAAAAAIEAEAARLARLGYDDSGAWLAVYKVALGLLRGGESL